MRAKGVAESPVRVEFTVQFSHGPKGRRRAREVANSTHATGSAAAPATVASAKSVPKITRLLVLGHHFERLVREGAVKDYAEIARLTGLTRARVTQIVNLTLLAPEIQEQILWLHDTASSPNVPIEAQLRRILAHPEWTRQRQFLQHLERIETQPTPER